MAEERLIDDDLNKDKKYKIRKNADGEDELYIEETPEEEAEPQFEIPELETDDEEAAVLTPEQLLAREQARREAEEKRAARVAELVAAAEAKLAENDYSGALYELSLAEELDTQSGAVYSAKIRALTCNFSDLSRIEDIDANTQGVADFCTVEQKSALKEISSPVVAEVEKLEELAAEMHVRNEQKKSERREVFIASSRRALTWFSITTLPFLLFTILAISFSAVIFAYQDGRNVILTIVFASLAGLFFIATLFTAHKLWDARRKLSLNEKNSSTKLGREYESLLSEISVLKALLAAVGD